jgi:hypothetical protein
LRQLLSGLSAMLERHFSLTGRSDRTVIGQPVSSIDSDQFAAMVRAESEDCIGKVRESP